jgi:thiamine biosynthesis lipoprotein
VRRELALLDELIGRESGTKSLPVEQPSTPAPQTPAVGASRDRTRMLMDSLLRIQVRDGSDATAAAAIDDAFAEVARLESLISTWRASSPASALNRSAGGDAIAIPAELGDLLASSLALDRLTGGAFDVTAGPIIDLWRKSAERGVWPDTEQIDAARARSASIELDPSGLRARLTTAGAAIDLGGIGKGYALDRARAVLVRDGVHAALLDFGGQMLALGPPPGEKSWTVELCDPRRPGRTLVKVDLVEASLSSSADHERGFEIAGRRVSHIVDPRTGMPVEGMIGASVIRPSAAEADALSTALFVMGAENGLKFAQDHGYAALLVDGAGAITRTSSFPEIGPAHESSPAVDATGLEPR